MKILKYLLPILAVILLIGAFIFYPKYQRGMEIDALMQPSKYAHSFINMEKYFPAKEVKKSPNPYMFPKKHID